MKGLQFYTRAELLKRVIWQLVYTIFFKYSPRHIYGWRNFLLKVFGAKIGKRVKIFPSATVIHPWLLTVGDNSVISWNVRVYNLGKITIGNNCIISQYAHLCAGTHLYDDPEFKLIRSEISIGNNVWVAADAFVGPDIIINDYALIAARAVVVKNVDFNCIVGGNPAKIIGKRFKDK